MSLHEATWWKPSLPPLPCDGISATSVAQIMRAPEFPDLMEEYAAESAIAGLPPPVAKIEHYLALDITGAVPSFVAMKSGAMIGFITVLAPVLPHYGIVVAVVESFFVAAAHRKGGAGLRLLAAAEGKARELSSPGLLVCAPIAGRLFEVLPRRGYRETSRVFFKRLADA